VSSDIEIENEYILALQLDAASVAARHGYAMFLSNRGRSDEAIAQFRQALLLDPLSASVAGRLGVELIVIDQIDEGMALIRRAVEIEPWQFNVQLRLGWTCAVLGQFDEANRAFAAAEQISPDSPDPLAGRGYVAALSGNVEEATAALDELQARAGILDTPFLVAIVYVGLRDSDGALTWLEKAAIAWNIFGRDGLFGLDSPIYDWLREDPRFDQVRQALDASLRDANS
jgi:Flp pilus assembly protein TadD